MFSYYSQVLLHNLIFRCNFYRVHVFVLYNKIQYKMINMASEVSLSVFVGSIQLSEDDITYFFYQTNHKSSSPMLLKASFVTTPFLSFFPLPRCVSCKNYIFFLFMFVCLMVLNATFKEYLKLLNRLYDITWFGSVYA